MLKTIIKSALYNASTGHLILSEETIPALARHLGELRAADGLSEADRLAGKIPV